MTTKQFITALLVLIGIFALANSQFTLAPHENPEFYPHFKWELDTTGVTIQPNGNPLFRTDQRIKFRLSFNIEKAPGDFTIFALDTPYRFDLESESIKCYGALPNSLSSAEFPTGTSSQLGGTTINLRTSFPTQTSNPSSLKLATRIKIQCIVSWTAAQPVSELPFVSTISSNDMALPLFEEPSVISVTSAAITIRRSLTQTRTETTTLPIANEVDDPLTPRIEAIPITSDYYFVDISVDITEPQYVFFDIITRTAQLVSQGIDSVSSADIKPLFTLSDSDCEDKLDFVPAAYLPQSSTPPYKTVIGFKVTEAGFYNCRARFIANDMLQHDTSSFTATNTIRVATAPINGETGLPGVLSPWGTNGTPFALYFPVIFGALPQLSPQSSMFFPYDDVFDAITGELPTDLLAGEKQRAAFDALKEAKWSMVQDSEDPNVILVTITNLGSDSVAAFGNSVLHAKPFNLISIPSAGSQSDSILIAGHPVQSASISVSYEKKPLASIAPTGYPYITLHSSAGGNPNYFDTELTYTKGISGNDDQVTFRLFYPLFVPKDRPVTGNCQLASESINNCHLLHPSSADLKDWTVTPGASSTTFSTSFSLYLNGQLILPQTPNVANVNEGTLTMTSSETVQPQVKMFFATDEAGNTPVDLTQDWTEGDDLFFTLDFPVGAPINRVFTGKTSYVIALTRFVTSEFSEVGLFSTSKQQTCTVPLASPNGATMTFSFSIKSQRIELDQTTSLSSAIGTFGAMTSVATSKRCVFKFSPQGYSDHPYPVRPENKDGWTSAGLYLPKIVKSTLNSPVGIQATRPFFLNQINFGTLKINTIPFDTKTVSFYYRQLSFRPTSLEVVCIDEDGETYPAKFVSTGDLGGTAQLAVAFNDPTQIETREPTELNCPSIPLVLLNFNNGAGLQYLTAGKTVQKQTTFPQLYAFSVKSTLTPGRISTINFSVTSSIPGTWIVQMPYAVDPLVDPFCRHSSGDAKMDIEYKQAWLPAGTECDDYFHGVCPTVAMNAFVITSHFETSSVNNPQTCTFSATRRYSSEQGVRTTAVVSFPDEVIGSPLYKYKTNFLFPTIGSLPPTVDLQIEPPVDATNKGALRADFFNVQIAKGEEFAIYHEFPFEQDNSLMSRYPTCVFSTDTSSETFSQQDNTNFMRIEYAKDASNLSNRAYKIALIFLHALNASERVSCSISLNYADLPARKAQTAIGFGNVGTVATAAQNFTSYLYLPPVTSAYELSFDANSFSTSTANTSTFKLDVSNVGGKTAVNNAVYVRFNNIGLVPFNDQPDSTFTCAIGGDSLITAYSRLTDYVLRIELGDKIDYKPNTVYTIECTVKYLQPDLLTRSSNAFVDASLYEANSGQYNLKTAAVKFTPPVPSGGNQPYLFVKFLSPSLANEATRVSNDNYVTAVKDIFTKIQAFVAAQTSPSQELTDIIAALAKINSSGIKLIQRQAYFRKVTSLTDSYAQTGASQRISALDIQDVASVIIPTSVLTAAEITHLKAIFSSSIFWVNGGEEFTRSVLQPFDLTTMIWQSDWPLQCFESTFCGLGCPQLCTEGVTCTSDFNCASGYCKAGADKAPSTCQVKDFSTFPADFFSDYLVTETTPA